MLALLPKVSSDRLSSRSVNDRSKHIMVGHVLFQMSAVKCLASSDGSGVLCDVGNPLHPGQTVWS